MAGPTSSKAELQGSRYGDVKQSGQAGGGDVAPFIDPQLSLAKVVSDDASARAWRVTLSPLRRNDGRSILVKGTSLGDPLFESATQQYAAGANVLPQVPPRRVNPIFGSGVPQNGATLEPVFVQIVWGMSVGQRNSLIAHWPYQGASIVIEASFVEVYGGVAVQNAGVSPGNTTGFEPIGGAITFADFPTLGASVTPTDGLASDSAGELSITQNVDVAAFAGAGAVAGFYTDGIAHPEMGFQVGAAPFVGTPAGAIAVSTVYNTAPFVSWNAVISAVGPGGAFNTTSRLIINTSPTGGPLFTLSDNAEPDGGGGFGSEPPNVAINYFTNGVAGVKTVAQLEALINTSQILHVAVPDTVNAAKLVNAGFTQNPGTHAPVLTPLFGTEILVAPTQGGAVYVPDFARRVKVELAQQDVRFLGNEFRVPIVGPVPAQLVWYDDSGNVVYTEMQGRTLNDDTSALGGPTEPNVWRPVPAQAVMLGIYSEFTGMRAFVHWRLAP